MPALIANEQSHAGPWVSFEKWLRTSPSTDKISLDGDLKILAQWLFTSGNDQDESPFHECAKSEFLKVFKLDRRIETFKVMVMEHYVRRTQILVCCFDPKGKYLWTISLLFNAVGSPLRQENGGPIEYKWMLRLMAAPQHSLYRQEGTNFFQQTPLSTPATKLLKPLWKYALKHIPTCQRYFYVQTRHFQSDCPDMWKVDDHLVPECLRVPMHSKVLDGINRKQDCSRLTPSLAFSLTLQEQMADLVSMPGVQQGDLFRYILEAAPEAQFHETSLGKAVGCTCELYGIDSDGNYLWMIEMTLRLLQPRSYPVIPHKLLWRVFFNKLNPKTGDQEHERWLIANGYSSYHTEQTPTDYCFDWASETLETLDDGRPLVVRFFENGAQLLSKSTWHARVKRESHYAPESLAVGLRLFLEDIGDQLLLPNVKHHEVTQKMIDATEIAYRKFLDLALNSRAVGFVTHLHIREEDEPVHLVVEMRCKTVFFNGKYWSRYSLSYARGQHLKGWRMTKPKFLLTPLKVTFRPACYRKQESVHEIPSSRDQQRFDFNPKAWLSASTNFERKDLDPYCVVAQ